LIENLHHQCFKGQAIILLGARQVGITTRLKGLSKKMDCPTVWLNADEADIAEAFWENCALGAQFA
jgi:hypothetical protein